MGIILHATSQISMVPSGERAKMRLGVREVPICYRIVRCPTSTKHFLKLPLSLQRRISSNKEKQSYSEVRYSNWKVSQ